MNSILKRFRDRESWVALLGNAIGFMVIFGMIGADAASEITEKGNESVGLIFMLISNVGFMISRGIAKAGGAPSSADQ